jgi:RimJ/RimL family protein N-acetyltransferase
MAADARFMRFLGAPPDPAQQLARIRAHWDEHGFGQLAVEERASGRVVGRSGSSYHRLWPQDVEVGWGIDPAAWGRGYATEAGAAAIGHAFDVVGVDRVVSIVHPENAASIRVAEKLGERPLATLPWDDTGIELVVYGIERDEWARLQSSG